MNAIRVALIQAAYDPAPGAMEHKYSALVADAAQSGARLVVLPELSITEYFPQVPVADRVEEITPEPAPNGTSCRLFAKLASDNGVFVVGSFYERGGLGFRNKKAPRFSSAVVFDPEGKPGAICRKQHLASGPLLHEVDYMQKGDSDYPAFRLPDVNLATPTGYDLWFPELARIFAMRGAELLAAPAAIGDDAANPGTDSIAAWTSVLQSHAITNGCFVAVANRVGTETRLRFGGGSVIIAPGGEILAQGSADGEEVVSADLDPVAMEKWREHHLFLVYREPETYKYLLGRLSIKRPDADPTDPSLP